ncbi:MAG: hypothetical protein R2787_16130 [Saprospiraceae bacterium]
MDEKKLKGTLPWIDTGWRREFGGYEGSRRGGVEKGRRKTGGQ